MLTIRLATDDDFEAIWQIFHEVVQGGDVFAYTPDTSREEAYRVWMQLPKATYVALLDDTVVGSYYLKPNQPGLGSHVCNAGYMVGSAARGHGIGRKMCEHSQQEARKMNFRAMQFNLVIATNHEAIKLWQDLGFEIVGRLPQAFQHQHLGLVDALMMYKLLD
jgi:L-amino acid N-acyltransferase YncA